MKDMNGNESLLLGAISHWQILFVVAMVAGAILLVKMGRKKALASQGSVSELSTRLAEIDPADYDFDGNKKQVEAPTANFDDFFSNASRRQELARDDTMPEPDSVGVPLAAAVAEPVVFPIPTLDDLPKPDPQEPAVSRDARDRLLAIIKAGEEKTELDPSYSASEEERFASAAFEAYSFCADGLGYFVMRAPDVPRFREIAEVARTVGAADLETIVGLQVKLMEMTSAPEWRERHEDDERWHPIKHATDQLSDLFQAANRNDGGAGRLSTLADAYLAGEW